LNELFKYVQRIFSQIATAKKFKLYNMFCAVPVVPASFPAVYNYHETSAVEPEPKPEP
jgi:hypothetical protein